MCFPKDGQYHSPYSKYLKRASLFKQPSTKPVYANKKFYRAMGINVATYNLEDSHQQNVERSKH